MKYVFEDDERDIISKFFMEAFPKVVSSEFIYAKHTGMIHTFYGVYYNSDCLCKCADSECIQEELLGKTIRYISEYPCIPENSLALSSKSLSVNDLWIVHKELVDEYNTMESEYEAYDSGNITSYKKIKAF